MTSRIVLLCILMFLAHCAKTPSVWAESMPIGSYLEEVFKSSEELRAIELDITSLQLEIEARELELSPTFAAQLVRFWDKRPSLSSSQQSKGTLTELSLSKPFSTGTSFNMLAGAETSEYTSGGDEQNLLNWQLGVSQSLWQNSFGRQTRLRRQRDDNELRNRLLTLMQERQNILIEFELIYWDINYARQEVTIRQENLERSRRIFSWIKERYDRSAAESVDLLQGQTLVASRELQLQLSEDNFKTLQARLSEKMLGGRDFIPDPEELKKDRELSTLTAIADFAPPDPVLIETLQSKAKADFLKATADLESDKLRPILEIGYAYGQQGLDTSFSRAHRESFSRHNNYHEVGVVFSMPLDLSLISKSRRSREATTQAQQLRAAKFSRQSDVQWEDLARTVQEQKQRVATAMKLAELQKDKGQQERVRYEKGRSTAFVAISFEQEAAEGDLLVLQLLAQLRRSEAQARLYVTNSGGGK